MEEMVLFRHKTGSDGAFIQAQHIFRQLCATTRELSPIIVCLSVVIDKNGWIDALGRQSHRISKWTLRTIRNSNALRPVRKAHVQVI